MERLKSTTIILFLAVGLLSSAASAKTTSMLLQEGLYAEEIEGDLDAAIKIYEQVISESKKVKRDAAQATYRIGMCYIKKGEKVKAAEQFQNLISKYPEQKTLITKSQEQLKKLGPAFMGSIDSAEPVPVNELIKSGKVPAFKTQIYDNTGLDLETGISVPFMDEWPALCEVAWDNDGGGALMIKPSSSVRFLALGGAEKWEDAISKARNSLAVLRTSTSKGMFASESKFGSVLTSEGNLAVIQIGEYDANKGTIYGWIEKIPGSVYCFGPVMERVINDDGEEKNWLIDFDTGKLFSHTTEIPSEEEFLRWCAENRIDAMGETRASSPGLYGFDMASIPIATERWNTISPTELAEDLSIAKVGTPTFMSAMGDLPVAYIFKTREGGMGVVQILEMQDNKKPRHFRIRYKMLRPVAVKETVNLNVGKPAYEWWRSEPIVTHTIYEDSQLEIVWDVEPEMTKKILSFSGGVLPMKGDISDIEGHLWWVEKLAFTVRRTPYGKKWGRTEGPKPLKSGEYRIYICAFDDTGEGRKWRDMLKTFLVGSATAKLIVKPRPSTQIATPREAKSPIDLSTPEATIKSFVKAVYVGNLEAAKACVSKDGPDYDEFMEMLATESNHPFQAMIKAMDASIPVEITSKDITEDRCKIKWCFTLGRVYYIGDGETKWKKGMHPEFSSYLELVGDKWLIRDI